MHGAVKSLIKIARLLTTDDSGNRRFGVIRFQGKQQQCQVVTPYGLMSSPPADSMAVTLSQNGQESNALVIADDPDNRPLRNLKMGESGLGNYITGDHFHFDNQGVLHLNVSQQFIITIGDHVVTIDENGIHTNKQIDTTDDVISDIGGNGVSLNNHVHTNVQSGSGTSGPPQR